MVSKEKSVERKTYGALRDHLVLKESRCRIEHEQKLIEDIKKYCEEEKLELVSLNAQTA